MSHNFPLICPCNSLCVPLQKPRGVSAPWNQQCLSHAGLACGVDLSLDKEWRNGQIGSACLQSIVLAQSSGELVADDSKLSLRLSGTNIQLINFAGSSGRQQAWPRASWMRTLRRRQHGWGSRTAHTRSTPPTKRTARWCALLSGVWVRGALGLRFLLEPCLLECRI